MTMRLWIALLMIGSSVIASNASSAELDRSGSGCAVSGINGKLEAAGGYIDSNVDNGGRAHGLGSFSVPLGCRFGLQLDGGAGVLSGEEAGGVATHLFTRDPTRYLIGAYGQWGTVGSNDLWRVGGEAEGYFGNVSVEALVGYEDSDFHGEDVFAAVDVAFYPTENFRVYGGYARFLDLNVGSLGFEWMPSHTGLGQRTSFFVDGAVGEDDFATVYGGVRIYFGGSEKSLMRRHREDDPSAKGIFRLLAVTDPPPGPPPLAPPPPPEPPPPPPPPEPEEEIEEVLEIGPQD